MKEAKKKRVQDEEKKGREVDGKKINNKDMKAV